MEKIAQANKCSCPVPESILKTDRWELNDIEMKIEGKLPDDIQGHVFIVAPVGTVESGGLPFPVDYENQNRQIVLHIPHICAWEISEWLRKFDLSVYPPNDPLPSRLHSMQLNPMDISRMGRYTVDGETARVIDSKVMFDYDCTWGVGLYAYNDGISSTAPTKKLKNIYWTSFGLWKDLMTKFAFDLYKDYKYRGVPLPELLSRAEKGIPAYLFCMKTTQESMNIIDRFEFPCGYMVSSPQFVPCRGEEGEPNSIKGYIVCTVFSPDKSEIWIFNAENLDQGPICKLSHPSLKFGFTLHTAWLSKIGRRQGTYKIIVRQDYDKIIKQKSPEIQELFEKQVYPYFY